jgi:hypothetical protein
VSRNNAAEHLDACVDDRERSVTQPSPIQFRSTHERGFSSVVSSHPRRVLARKVAREIHAQFASGPSTVQTQEGLVHAQPGDAIVTGTAGEQWRVSQASFLDKYRPVAPTAAGETGQYVSLDYLIMAIPMTERFEVVLADHVSRLSGQPGDWLVDYGDGSLGVVAKAIFATTYEIVSC